MKNWIKYSIAFTSVMAFRLMPFRAPNVEPIMATLMPMGKIYGKLMAFVFGFGSIALYDAVTSGFGVWTLVTAVAYGALGLGATYFFQNRSGRVNYALYAVIATIIYDAVTGLTIGPLFFHQSFLVSLAGQIPFTLLHLVGNVSFAIVLSPMIEKWFMAQDVKAREINKVVLVS